MLVIFLCALIGGIAKLKSVTDRQDWVLPVWLGIAIGFIAGIPLHAAFFKAITH